MACSLAEEAPWAAVVDGPAEGRKIDAGGEVVLRGDGAQGSCELHPLLPLHQSSPGQFT